MNSTGEADAMTSVLVHRPVGPISCNSVLFSRSRPARAHHSVSHRYRPNDAKVL